MQNRLENNEPKWTILDLLKWTTTYFHSHAIDSPRAAAEILLAEVLGLKRIDLYLRYDQPLNRDELSAFKYIIKRRTRREPIPYILESKEFWSLELCVNPDVLIPRPETEHLVEVALSQMPKPLPLRILELGTGSGAISIALASERPEHRLIAVDRSINAVRIARENAGRHHVEDRINFFVGEWFQSLNEHFHPFDMIVSNPPYIKTGDIGTLQPEIYEYEPHMALDGGEDGLQWIRHIIFHASRYLKPGGILILEIGHDQKEAIQKIIASLDWCKQVDFIMDYSGHHRIMQLQKKNRF